MKQRMTEKRVEWGLSAGNCLVPTNIFRLLVGQPLRRNFHGMINHHHTDDRNLYHVFSL